jgi:GT2 family glycosyltransferase
MTARFSVLTTVYDPEPQHLQECLDSVAAQTWPDAIEHVIVDDASQRDDVRRLLDRSRDVHGRHIVRRSANGGIVAASNDALAQATGEWVVLLDHDDVLAGDALERVAAALDADPAIDVLYTDHDLLRPDGRLSSPVYKPDFSLERLRNHNWITHLVVVRRSLIDQVGGFTVGADGAQDHDLLLRLAEASGPFHHLPEVLLHWRQAPASVAFDVANKPEAFDRVAEVVGAHLQRAGVPASVDAGDQAGVVRIRREIEGRPLVSVVIPTRGSRGPVWGVDRIFVHQAVSSLIAGTTTDDRVDLEFVVVVDAATPPVVERGLRRLVGDRLTTVAYDRVFNFSDAINSGVAAASGDYVLLLNDDTELIEPASVAEMVGLAQQTDVGMVGAKLLYEDGTLQHAGHSYHGTVSHALLGWPGKHPGPNRMLAVERECAGVTAAAALLRRSVFNEVGGMNLDFAINYNDVDFSLTLRHAGYRVLWTPHASWFHFEQRSFDHPIVSDEIELLRRRWGEEAFTDPYANPNLTRGRTDWLEEPLRSGAPPYEVLPDGRVSWG